MTINQGCKKFSYGTINGAAPSWNVNKRAYMASPQAPPTPISKLSDMTPKLCVQNDPARCYLHLGSLSNMTRVQVDPVLPSSNGIRTFWQRRRTHS
ncbi:hypothetical protein OUZ56_012052 [Daphnia magna]|uniref:Uncharacterized protein n=1 Tax=Daphnia magna TaxID=35525 RepID=A0ABQ9Z1W4_9CRUS|nr:hypothetical protein OUZ56_012052 [Daphnia magna]